MKTILLIAYTMREMCFVFMYIYIYIYLTDLGWLVSVCDLLLNGPDRSKQGD